MSDYANFTSNYFILKTQKFNVMKKCNISYKIISYDRKAFGVFLELCPFLIKTLKNKAKKPSESFLMGSALPG